jgi:hypothetical protein
MEAAVIIFCADPMNERQVDPAYRAEKASAAAQGFLTTQLDHDYLDHRIDAVEAVRRSKPGAASVGLYRGWMMRSEAYTALHEALLARGVRLLTNPTQYEACHHAPGSYSAISQWMPDTVFVPRDQLDTPGSLEEALAHFKGGPIIIKDWVKSQAGYWDTACFIPISSDIEQAKHVVATFRDLQGDSLVGGVVFKAYKKLVVSGTHPLEFRAIIFDGRSIGCWPRSATSEVVGPPQALIDDIAKAIPSPFASADFGVDETGRWWLLEVGDGQVSELPSDAAVEALYEALGAYLQSHNAALSHV